MHPAALGVAVHVGDQKDESRQDKTDSGDDACQCQRSKNRVVLQLWRKDLVPALRRAQVHQKRDALREEEEQDDQDDQPSRDDAKLVPEPKILLLPAKAYEPHPFVEGSGHLLRIVRHSFLFLHSSKSGPALRKTSGEQAPPPQKSF